MTRQHGSGVHLPGLSVHIWLVVWMPCFVVVRCRHTLEELEQLVEVARQAVPGVEAAIAAAIDRKVNPVSHLCLLTCWPTSLHAQQQSKPVIAAAVDRKVNPVSHLCLLTCCPTSLHAQQQSKPASSGQL